MRRPPGTFPCVAVTIILAACAPEEDDDGVDQPATCEGVEDVDEYAPGMELTGAAGYTVALDRARPAPPAKGDNQWDLTITDPDDARADVALEVLPFMPEHNHGSAVPVVVEPGGDVGEYVASPINLFMAGRWEITMEISDTEDALVDEVVFAFCVDP